MKPLVFAIVLTVLIFGTAVLSGSDQLTEAQAISAACPTCIDAMYALVVGQTGLVATQDCTALTAICGSMRFNVLDSARVIMIINKPLTPLGPSTPVRE